MVLPPLPPKPAPREGLPARTFRWFVQAIERPGFVRGLAKEYGLPPYLNAVRLLAVLTTAALPLALVSSYSWQVRTGQALLGLWGFAAWFLGVQFRRAAQEVLLPPSARNDDAWSP